MCNRESIFSIICLFHINTVAIEIHPVVISWYLVFYSFFIFFFRNEKMNRITIVEYCLLPSIRKQSEKNIFWININLFKHVRLLRDPLFSHCIFSLHSSDEN